VNVRCARSKLSRFIVFLCDTSVWVEPRPKALPGGVGCFFTVRKNERVLEGFKLTLMESTEPRFFSHYQQQRRISHFLAC
jgi:hypothetical protein